MVTFVVILVMKQSTGLAAVAIPGYTDVSECTKAIKEAYKNEYVIDAFYIPGPSK